METTLTQRDKALLLILGIILIIFAAVMIPKVGIYALITSQKEIKTKIGEQTNTNNDLYMELIQSGISGAVAENPVSASRRLKDSIANEKHDVAKIASSIYGDDSFSAAKAWVATIKDKGFVSGEQSLFDSVSVYPQTVIPGAPIELFEVTYYVDQIPMDIKLDLSQDISYTLDLQYCDNAENLSDLFAMLVATSQVTRRGSCIVSDFNYEKAELDDEAKSEIEISILVLKSTNKELKTYGQEICECHNCGYIYTQDWFATQVAQGDGDTIIVFCPNCSSDSDPIELDGTSIDGKPYVNQN